MIKTYKVMLVPNKKQITRFFQFSGTARFAYNWAVAYQKNLLNENKKILSYYELRREFIQLKHNDDSLSWVNSCSNKVTQQSIKDACNAFSRYFNKNAKFPKFKSKHRSKQSFYVGTDKIRFTETHVILEKISLSKKRNKSKLNYVRLAEIDRIPTNVKYYNTRVTFDGINWWISVSVEEEFEPAHISDDSDGLGIDLGIKDLAVCSDENIYKNINKTKQVRKLEKRKKRLQRQISKKYLLNNEGKQNQKGVSYCKTKNIVKLERKLLLLNHRLTNIRHNYLHQTTSEIIDRKPKYIVLEDLNVRGMMKNRHLAKSVQQQCFYEFMRQIEYKSKRSGIEVIKADRWYPSSKKCSVCGNIKKDLKLSDRTYRCEMCGLVIDRDFQASVNLKNFIYM